MKVDVTKERVAITECHVVTEGEYCVNECEFQLPECFEGLTVTAVFNDIPVPLLENKCFIPSLKKGGAVLGVYAYRKNGEDLELVYSPKPTAFYVDEGSYTGTNGIEEVPELSKYEEYCTMLSQLCENLISQIDCIERASLTQTISSESTHSQVATAGAVYEYGREITEELNDEITELDEKQTAFMSSVSNALKANASGESVVIYDNSPIPHYAECKIKSKNIIRINDTGEFFEKTDIVFDKVYPPGTYSLSAVVESDDINSDKCFFWFTLDGSTKRASVIKRTVDGNRTASENIIIASEFNGMTFFASSNLLNSKNDKARLSDIQLEAGKVATDYVPYVEIDNVGIVAGGKNLSSIRTVQCKVADNNGACYKKVDLGYSLPPCKYSFSAMVTSTDVDTEKCAVILLNESDGVSREVSRLLFSKNGASRVSIENQKIDQPFNCLAFYPAENESASAEDSAMFSDIQIEYGTTATAFEEYKKIQELPSNSQGYIDDLVLSYPVSTILSSKEGVLLDVTYNRDINKVLASIEARLSDEETA